jgi:hypothetical protein
MTMARRSSFVSEAEIAKKSIISDYVRLSLSDGVRPVEVYRKLKLKLPTVKKLKDSAS